MISNINYIIKDSNGAQVISKLDDNRDILEIIDKNEIVDYKSQKYRVGIVKSENALIIAYTASKHLIKSSKMFNSYLEILGLSVDNLIKDKKQVEDILIKQTNILIHNLISLNAHNIQEIYNIVPQDSINNSIPNKKQFIANIIKSNPDKTALAILKLMKNNIAMKTEFSVFAKLFEKTPKLNMKEHNIHKVLMNILYSFFPDFTDKQVNVNVHSSTLKAYFDYESIYVVFFHLIENATKYIQNNSEFNIKFNDYNNEVEIIFDMMSLKINDNEKEKIFEEGYSGKYAVKNEKEGKGIGMSRVKKLLELNNAKIYLNTENACKSNCNDFENNIFKIKFKKINYLM